ncbi:AbrB/MazE/SpoVT family DNA-binding domain-containing protein [Clostridium sp.]|uniref:AbrB/MazE/SpoVT family DNA-binding domain-containing protein n=1 Tax=Clostridium sp. TaxID=1506 RepID=UPI003216352F
MKATGVVRNIDPLGRIVIPKEVRRNLGFQEGTPIEIFVNEDEVILRKYVVGCHCCGETENLTSFEKMDLCPDCMARITEATARIKKFLKDEESRGK